jgi:hypothetical protein
VVVCCWEHRGWRGLLRIVLLVVVEPLMIAHHFERAPASIPGVVWMTGPEWELAWVWESALE